VICLFHIFVGNRQRSHICKLTWNKKYTLFHTNISFQGGIGKNILIELMNKEGWEFVVQLGAGHIFSKDMDRLIITSVQYTRKYRVWTLTD